MTPENITARARLRVHQARPYYDKLHGVWLYKQVGVDEEVDNILTDAGRRTLHTYIYGTAAQRITASLGAGGLNYIGLSNNGSAPAASDTTLTAELTTDGLGRAQGTVTLPVSSGTITQIQNTFTYSGVGTQEVQKTALFDASSAGNMAHEILFTQRSLATNDTLTLTFSIGLT